MSSTINMTSNKPYIVGAFYDWISDNELTPYIVVDVNVMGVQVPMAFVNDGQIVLNISSTAVGSIVMGGSAIEFSARFGGKLEHLYVPYGAIAAIYAKENGAGTSLPIEHPEEVDGEIASSLELQSVDSTQTSVESKEDNEKKDKPRPTLKVVK
ncbi:MAG: ClpXP protease specificity-enhancing factor [Thalassotalea sp.]|nr:ClpXP protease specificity-enhancing factor [Thalassotalea sp.]